VCTSATGRGLVHHRLLHPPSTDLAAVVAPLIAGALSHSEPVLAALPPMTTAQVQNCLPAVVTLHTVDPARLCRHPGRALGHFLSWIADTRPDGHATIVAAPQLGDDAHRAALWMQIDALAGQALAACDLTLVCVYPDGPTTAAAVRQAHSSLLNGAAVPSPDYLPTPQFLASHPLPPPTDLGPPDSTAIIDHAGQLTNLRRTAATYAARAGLSPSRGEDFVLAVSEVASNALEHGAPPAAVCWWITPTLVICQISDNGHFTDRLAGLLPPQARQSRSRGLWMAYQLCDQVYRWTEPTIIRLQMDRSGDIKL
jgi:anti-sigma regulatory factor (Ser/Thr protein kinase)